MLVGSPEWFNEKSKTKNKVDIIIGIEELRYSFLKRFSPEKLSKMTGEELLDKVFAYNKNSMLWLLMFDNNKYHMNYRWFGAAGEYKCNFIVYHDNRFGWSYKERKNPDRISKMEAAEKAVYVRDKLLECINVIKAAEPINSIEDYKKVKNKISGVFFYDYTWVIKYYQMVFPFYFAGMYSDEKLTRAIQILGLRKHGNNKFLNSAEISLFIRKCNVNNIVFNDIYSDEWGWEGDRPPCENATDNYCNSGALCSHINKSYYRLSDDNAVEETAIKIDNEICNMNLEGQTKEAIVKVRVNQGEFRDMLLRHNSKCCLCGVQNPSILVASHIKPWSVSDSKEKLDINNGFLMCPNHDKLFDRGYISFDDNGQILISNEMKQNDRIFMNVRPDMTIELSDKNKEYLKYHRKNVFKK